MTIPLRALVVEDDRQVRRILSHILESQFGLEVEGATSGSDGLLALARQQPALLLLDLTFPDFGGVEVLAEVRRSPTLNRLPVVVVSANRKRELISRVAALGISDFILKPFEVDGLIRRLRPIVQTLLPTRDRPVTTRLGQGESTFLVIDGDANMQSHLASMLSSRGRVLVASSGEEALRLYLKEHPTHVLLGQGISLFTPQVLASMLRSRGAAIWSRMYLLDDIGSQHVPDGFEACLPRTYLPEVFLGAARDHLASTPSKWLQALFQAEWGRQALISATSQTIGVMAQTAIKTLPNVPALPVASCWSTVELRHPASEVTLTVGLVGGREVATSVARLVLADSAVTDGDTDEVWIELVQTIAGRVRHALSEQMGLLELGLPLLRSGPEQPNPTKWDLSVAFELGPAEVIVVGLLAAAAPPQAAV